jgi:hypothetical protein
MPTPYDPMELKRFLDQWKPEPEDLPMWFPNFLRQFKDFTIKSYGLFKEHLRIAIALYGYTMDDSMMHIDRRPDLK